MKTKMNEQTHFSKVEFPTVSKAVDACEKLHSKRSKHGRNLYRIPGFYFKCCNHTNPEHI